MSRINTNVASLIAQRVLRQNNDLLATSLERLSTGLRINRGADDPSGLIASEVLRAEKAGLDQAIDNAERASNIIGTAEGGLNEISALLVELQGLVSEAANTAGLSADEIAANQLQVDSILQTIDRIAQSTSFKGTKLLNGNYEYTLSGVDASSFDDVRVNAARLPDGQAVTVVVEVLSAAETGLITYTNSTLTDTVKLEIAGNLGTEQITLADGTTVTAIASAINLVKDVTGVSATVSSGDLKFESTQYGSSQFVSIKTISGTFVPSAEKDFGKDVVATINGASAQADGLTVNVRGANLDLEIDLDTAFNVAGSDSFAITAGGATFALGSRVTESDKVSIGLPSVSAGSLGKSGDGFLSSLATGGDNDLDSGNLTTSQRVIDAAIKQVAQLRGRLGAFQKFTLGSVINSLGVALENVSAAESAVRDTDFAEQTAALTRAQILAQAATSVLAQANLSPSLVLSLLQG